MCRRHEHSFGVTNRGQDEVKGIDAKGAPIVRPLDSDQPEDASHLRLPADYMREDVQLGYASASA